MLYHVGDDSAHKHCRADDQDSNCVQRPLDESPNFLNVSETTWPSLSRATIIRRCNRKKLEAHIYKALFGPAVAAGFAASCFFAVETATADPVPYPFYTGPETKPANADEVRIRGRQYDE